MKEKSKELFNGVSISTIWHIFKYVLVLYIIYASYVYIVDAQVVPGVSFFIDIVNKLQ